ncbi:fibronectin type III domain-containing protein [Nakamurella deserti]|uniref:fibronectin type III domain-containing protein n=1 Tax=Nakamurella deserti TaxID=2164074 RepID=UPI000DBE995C|nr:fibronectin type III domain-containing protein [Nakamurella deserti]
MRLFRVFLAVLLTATAVNVVSVVRAPDAGAAVPAAFSDTLVASLSYALDTAARPDRSLLVATKSGVVRTVRNGALVSTPALDLTAKVCSNYERGLLGIATDPTSATYLWAFYTARDAGGTCAAASGAPNPSTAPRNRVSRFTFRSDGTVDPASERVLLDGIFSTSGYHNAGDLELGKDGNLYISTGDGQCDYLGGPANPGGSGCNGANDTARDRNVLNAKVLRITRDGGIPTDNPFTGAGTARCATGPSAPGTICQETWAWGLRNPYRMAFDPNATGTSFRINDVGQDVWDEIDQGSKGADYGWNVREGHCAQTGPGTACSGLPTPTGFTDPVYDYDQSDGCASITGGAYVPNGIWPSQFTGSYLFADYVCGKIFALAPDNRTRTDFATGMGAVLSMSFGPDTAGSGTALYYTVPDGLRKISYTAAANRAPTARITAAPAAGTPRAYTFDGSASSDPDGGALSYTWAFGDGTPTVTTSTPGTSHTYDRDGTFTATLTVTDPGGLTNTAGTTLQVGDDAPVPTIVAPAATDLFSVNSSYTLRGTATDTEDGTLPGSSLSWTVIKHHDTHTHPVLGPVTGATATITAPPPEDPSSTTTTFLEIRLTATDSRGASTTVTREFRPRTVPVTVVTAPAGLQVTVNATPVKAPSTFTSWAAWAVPVAAAAQNDSTGRPYTFTRWSDGGAAAHAFATPAAAATLTATFTAAGPASPTAVTAQQTAAGTATLTWSPPPVATGETITGYRVSRDGKDSTGYGAYSTVVPATQRQFSFGRLVTGSAYNLTVQAVTAAGTSATRGGAVTVRAWTAPVAPTAVTVAPTTTAGSAAITWSPPADTGGQPVTGYRVSRNGTDSTGYGAYSTVVPASQRSFTFGRLVPGQTYTVTVAAVTAAGTSPAHGAQVRVGTGAGIPAPRQVSVVQVSSTSQSISWQPPTVPAGTTITGYTVTRDGKGATGYGPYTTTVPASQRSVTVTNLVPGTTYTMTVKANVGSTVAGVASGGVLIR